MVTHSDSLAQLAKAKAAAQAKFLPIGKDKSATVSMKAGGSYSYAYADLATCLDAVTAALSENGLALFQPTRVEDGVAIATTLLVHESGEWISSDYAAIAVDPRDARSVGSAATYARRYGLIAMLAIASTDEDDDGETARGGSHEMAKEPVARPVCPVCAKEAIIQGKPEYGGGWLCFKKRGGCGAKWPDGPFPTAAPPDPFAIQKQDTESAGNALFPDAAPGVSGEELVKRIGDRIDMLSAKETPESKGRAMKNAVKIWHESCGTAKFLDPAVDPVALTDVLLRLGGKI